MSTITQFPSTSDEGFSKIIWQDANDELFSACAGIMTQYVGDDGGIKSAASEVFSRAKLAEYRPPSGKFMMHIVAMGSEEAYGPNRNGDGFSKAALQAYHPTFVSDGHMFREHRNRDPKLAIGEIKASAYNEPLERVELILWGDCEKAASEYAKLKSGEPLSGSMSCRVNYDECNCCGNRAKSAAYYCDHLRNHMLQYLPRFQKYAYAKNPHPRFFDYSTVERPADRIAHALQWHITDQLTKAASASEMPVSGAEWASLMGVQLPLLPREFKPLTVDKLQLLEKLASMEAQAERWFRSGDTSNPDAAYFNLVGLNAFHPSEHLDMRKAGALQTGTYFRELAKRACLLSPLSLLSYVGDSAPSDMQLTDGMRAGLSTLFRDLRKQASCDGGLGAMADMCDPCSQLQADLDPEYDDSIDRLMRAADELFGVGQVEPRTISITIIKKASTQNIPEAKPTPEEQSTLALYGLYKLAALQAIPNLYRGKISSDELSVLSLAQNFIYAAAN